MGLPLKGRASTYSSYFSGRPTASGEAYEPGAFSAALLPHSNWHALPLGTRVKLTYFGRSVVVAVNDVGKGPIDKKTGINHDPSRVLDLSRAAMAFLLRVSMDSITDSNASVINIEQIEVVPSSTPLGPCK